MGPGHEKEEIMTRKQIERQYVDDPLMFADGFDKAIIGVGERCGQPPVVCYDVDKCISILVARDGMTRDEATEFIAFNTMGAWVGNKTPMWVSK